MNTWDTLADEKTIVVTSAALKNNGINALVVKNGEEAKNKVLEIIPKGAEVMDMSSVTLETIGLTKIVRESGKYDSVKKKLSSLDRQTQGREMRKLGAAPDYTVGSVHAITQSGTVIIASNTGSQLSAYVYGAGRVIWIVGTQKIVKDESVGFKRIHEYIVPLEAENMRQKYGRYGTNVSKVLIVNKEVNPERITVIFVKEKLGF